MRHKKLFAVILFLLIIFYVWGYFDNPGRTIPRFRATGYNGHFRENPAESFEDYIKLTRSNIKMARKISHVDDSEKVIDENSPVALFPDSGTCKTTNGKFEKGILLVHGLFDSTYPMQQLGKFFQSKCFVVYVILLPGHGSVPGDLLHTTYNDWVAATHFGAVKLAEKVENVYLGGFSLGGLLVINETLLKPDNIKGLFLFGPALKLGTPLAPFIPEVYWTSRVIPRLEWWSLAPDSGIARYDSVPINPVYQIRALMQIVHDKLERQTLQMPIFVEESAQDTTVDTDTLLHFFSKNKNPRSMLLWYYEHAPYPLFEDLRIQPIRSHLPELNILSMSHLSFILASDDPIYGRNGEYKDCLIYTPHSSNWDICENGGDKLFYGELVNEDLKTHIIRRITFNPFYDNLVNRMANFLGKN
jgi:esterase/lipase